MAGGIDFNQLPSLVPVVGDDRERPGLLPAGLKSGLGNLGGFLASAVEGTGRLTGLGLLERAGDTAANAAFDYAAASGRDDLEVAPWRDGGADVVPWLTYQTAKQIPTLAFLGAAGRAVPKNLSPQLAKAGARVPRALGGGGIRTGASFAERRAAIQAGAIQAGDDFSRSLIGAEVAGLPIAFGSMYSEADSKEGGATFDDAVRSLALSPVYSALDALQPAQLKGIVSQGMKGNILKRVATAGAVGAASEVPQEGLQTAMELSFRPDISTRDKFSQIVDAAVTGGAVGGVLGGSAGIRSAEYRAAKDTPAAELQDEDMEATIDSMLSLPGPSSLNAPEGATINVDPNGVAEPARETPYTQSEFDTRPQEIRPFAEMPDDQLLNARDAIDRRAQSNNVSPELEEYAALVEDEIARREIDGNLPLNSDGLTSEAVEVEPSQLGADALGEQGPTQAPSTTTGPAFQERLEGLRKGARNAWAKKVTAESESELLDKVHSRLFDEQDQTKGTQLLGQRLGLLDEDLNQTQLATEIGARKAAAETEASVDEPAAPANRGGGDTSVATEVAEKTKYAQSKGWTSLLKATKSGDNRFVAAAPDLLALNPANPKDAERQVYRALGNRDTSAGMERAAQELGILDENLDMTEKGRKLALQDPVTREAVEREGEMRGYTGAKLAKFLNGARAQMSGIKNAKDETGPFAAGRQFVIDTNYVPRVATNANQEAYDSEVGDGSDVAINEAIRNVRPDPRATPEQVTQQRINSLIDRRGRDNIAQLRQMAADGASIQEVEAAITKIERGGSIFKQPPRKDEGDFVGVTGDAISNAAIRRQRAAAMKEFGQSKGRGQLTVQEREARDRKNANAIRKFNLTQAVEGAVASGDFTQKDRIIAIHNLSQGRFDAVEEMLTRENQTIIEKEQAKVNRRQFLAGVASVAAVTAATPSRAALKFTPPTNSALMAAVKGSNVNSLLENLVKSSSSPMYRMIARKLLRGGGWENVNYTWHPYDHSYKRGHTTLRDDGSISIEIFGRDGTNEQTVLHELLHAYVMNRWASLSSYIGHNRALMKDFTDRGDDVLQRFQEIWRDFGVRLRRSNPELLEGDNAQLWAQVAVRDPDEMFSWVLTNPDAQLWLKGQMVDRRDFGGFKPLEKNLFDKIVDFVRGLLGLPATKGPMSALEVILSAGYSVIDAGKDVQTGDFSRKFAAALADQYNDMQDLTKGSVSEEIVKNQIKGPAPSLKAATDRAKPLVARLLSTVEATNPYEFGAKTRRSMLGWFSYNHMAREFGEKIPEIMELIKIHGERSAIAAKWAQMVQEPYAWYEQLPESDKRNLNDLMGLTQLNIDPSKDWDAHKHLHDEYNAAALKKEVARANNLYETAKRKGQLRIYTAFKNINEAQHMAGIAMSMHNAVTVEPDLTAAIDAQQRGISPFAIDPMEKFNALPELSEDPAAAREHWRKTIEAQMAAVEKRLETVTNDSSLSDGDRQAALAAVSPAYDRTKYARQALASLDRSPYFHLGRFGDYFVTFKARTDANGKVDPNAMNHIGQFLSGKGFDDINIAKETSEAQVFIRVDSLDKQRALHKLAKQLEGEGWLGDKEVRRGRRSQGEGPISTNMSMIRNILNSVDSLDVFNASDDVGQESDESKQLRAALKKQLKQLWLDELPDMSLTKVLVQRSGKAGFERNMVRSFAHRLEMGSTALSNLATLPKLNAAFESMKSRVKEAQVGGNDLDPNLGQEIMDEIQKRETGRPIREDNTWSRTLRAYNHAYFLGFSPSYVLVNTTQLGVLLWPELAKKHGFVKSAKAIAKVTPVAFRIMKEAAKQGLKVGPGRAADAVITEKVLQNAGLRPQEAKFMMKQISSGKIDIGGAARELARLSEGTITSKKDNMLRYASSFGLYSETFTRTIAALSARELQKGRSDVNEYASNVIDQSMLNYSNWHTSRQMGEQGFAGPLTPVMMSFLQYSAQVLEKLYSEMGTAFFKAAKTPQQRREARRFLAGHLSAVVALSGTMGLPFAAVAARVFEKLHDLFDDDEEPYDATASWRSFMADVFGKEMGEVASRGLPRAAGFDLSQRAGEQELFPFSEFLTDRRDWEESIADMTYRSAGAPVSMMTNIVKGGNKMMEGDILEGMQEAVPLAIKGGFKAYRMTEDGYVDSKGNKLPMEPGAWDVMVQILGFNPSEKAEYAEQKRDINERKGDLTRRANRISQHIQEALMSGDREAAQEYIQMGQKLAIATNGQYDPVSSAEAAIQRKMKGQVVAQITGTPVGVGAEDFQDQQLVDYANVDYRAAVR